MSGSERRVVVDRAVCVGSTTCVNVAGGSFEIDETDGKARVLTPGAATMDEVLDAVDSCPVAAISFEGEDK
ncbi:ferredoxin [Qaidamihabitans albus]|uniref:ferredoxin n=1 Tax=Qaidamihabitans albus TaxID=2795733 RepID=UPI0018F24168|nr:ferredoxin [Qaidamihabitans albus]